jgi:leucyl-tRNA synthetase
VSYPHRYDAQFATEIERRWREHWDKHGTWHAANPSGALASGGEGVAGRPKLYILDMFPYPSSSGLHVGHPLGYIATDIYARFMRMQGYNVLHTMGYDAFGLPAEQYAIQTGQHPKITTKDAIANYQRQLNRLGLGHDRRRSVATTDVSFYRWTQWIFLQLFNAWFDEDAGRARPIAELVAELESGVRPMPNGQSWKALSDVERRTVLDSYRLVYRAEAPVNWCPALGTVLANEEVTAEGRSERGNFPVYKRLLVQWMMRITAFADRLLADLDLVDWPEPIKAMQRNWIGRSNGATIAFPAGSHIIEVFTTRPDTVFGATFIVLAPEQPLVDKLVAEEWPPGTPDAWTGGFVTPREALRRYRDATAGLSDLDRVREARPRAGVYLGATARNSVTGRPIPVFVADYVLMTYGTGATMAVPGHDQRDFEFAQQVGLPIVKVVEPPADWPSRVDEWQSAYEGEGITVASSSDALSIEGLPTREAKAVVTRWLEEAKVGRSTVTYKLRDWLFSRQRYWGEPIPILYDETGLPVAVPESMLPVELPDMVEYTPTVMADDDHSLPQPPLARAGDWATLTLDLGEGPKTYHRELNTMPQWAGSCWYYLRYLDPTNQNTFVDPDVERYWMKGVTTDGRPNAGGVDLYVGGVEHAVLHLLYSRFWHKALFDLGYLSTPEPFQRLFNQGYMLAPTYRDERGVHIDADQVREDADGRLSFNGRPITREFGKMGKSLKNSISPDEIYAEYGADTLRLYEMAMGPLDADRPWSTTDIAGAHRLLQRAWRAIVDERSGAVRVVDSQDPEERRVLHRTIAAVHHDLSTLRFNTAIARITELVNHLTKSGSISTETAEALTLLLAPFAPHLAEELWSRLGHEPSVGLQSFPTADEVLLAPGSVTLVVQVNGKVRDRLQVATDADTLAIEAAALASPKIRAILTDKPLQKVIARPPALINLVVDSTSPT